MFEWLISQYVVIYGKNMCNISLSMTSELTHAERKVPHELFHDPFSLQRTLQRYEIRFDAPPCPPPPPGD